MDSSPLPLPVPVPVTVRLRRRAAALIGSRLGGAFLFLAVFAAVSAATRTALLLKAWSEAGAGPLPLARVFATGAVFDLGAGLLASLPLVVLLACLPRGWGTRAWHRLATVAAAAVVLFVLLFGAVAEWTFWEEFGARFNFIAVDYLVYTTEVLGNIRESYDLPVILGWVGAGGALGTALLAASGSLRWWLARAAEPAASRWRRTAGWVALAALAAVALDEARLPAFANSYHRELAKNGLWSLFAAFRSNSLDYERFYATLPIDQAFGVLRRELADGHSSPVDPASRDTLRWVRADGAEIRPNVIQITVESLSADFLGTFNHASHLTPNLTELASRSLVFGNFYATGTRTDRGMEALTLSLPPTPGRSMVKRPDNADLFTLGSVFRSRGYDTAFLYGGFGYFDNMNAFFGGNGYRVVDRGSPGADITFANAWGACDEDLYRWTLREADAAQAAGRPFHFFVMTTSNHRPYTYPEGRIDLPPKVSGRAGAVKYSDHAIGAFLRAAAEKPWFRDTVFVIVADHCASSAGRDELPIENYHIPLLIYAPGGQIAPGRIDTLTSQMDYAPTLLGLLNWSYPSRFFGRDVRRAPREFAHALVGTYQKLGHLERDRFVVLRPQRGVAHYSVDLAARRVATAPRDLEAEQEAISYYETASYLYTHQLYRRVQPAEEAALAARLPAPTAGAQ